MPFNINFFSLRNIQQASMLNERKVSNAVKYGCIRYEEYFSTGGYCKAHYARSTFSVYIDARYFYSQGITCQDLPVRL